MRIILEGPDGSGKSTLAKTLSSMFPQFEVQGSEGPEQYTGEIDKRIDVYGALEGPIIFDRHPLISEPIYRRWRVGEGVSYFREGFYGLHTIVYCQATDIELNQVPGEFDTPEFEEMLKNNYHNICKDYDRWALEKADFIYRKETANKILDPLLALIKEGLKP